MKNILWPFTATLLLFVTACKNDENAANINIKAATQIINPEVRIVSLSGTLTEIMCDFGWENQIVGVDVSSTYPASIAAKPKVGHNRNFSAEAIIALQPGVVVGVAENMKPELVGQLTRAGSRVFVFSTNYTLEGAQNLIRAVADSFNYTGDVGAILKQIDIDRESVIPLSNPPKVLFIYARGAGTLLASGTNTPAHSMIQLAGAKNAVTSYEDYKPLTAEALVSANPDVILMFDSGLQSLGGMSGLLNIPGVAETNAGKHKRVIEMDGQFLTGFGPRTGKAAAVLSQKLHEAISN